MEKVQRLGALDQALLFLSSLFGAVAAAVLLIPGSSPTGIATLAIFLVVTTLFPLYVGYMRGAVELDSVFERMRGWIYLIFGGGELFLTIGLRSINPPVGEITPVSLLLPPAFLLGFFLLGKLTVRLINWTYERVARVPLTEDDLAGFGGTMGALFMAFLGFDGFASLGAGFDTQPITNVFFGRLSILMFCPLFIFPLLYVEFNCHRPSSLRLAREGFEAELAKLPKQEKEPPAWARGMVVYILRMVGWARVASRDKLFLSKAIGAAVLSSIGNLAVAAYPWPGVIIMVLGDVIAYYLLWKYMTTTWANSARSNPEAETRL